MAPERMCNGVEVGKGEVEEREGGEKHSVGEAERAWIEATRD
jgi:hypothetical protein